MDMLGRGFTLEGACQVFGPAFMTPPGNLRSNTPPCPIPSHLPPYRLRSLGLPSWRLQVSLPQKIVQTVASDTR